MTDRPDTCDFGDGCTAKAYYVICGYRNMNEHRYACRNSEHLGDVVANNVIFDDDTVEVSTLA
jgi:hypothetical protein